MSRIDLHAWIRLTAHGMGLLMTSSGWILQLGDELAETNPDAEEDAEEADVSGTLAALSMSLQSWALAEASRQGDMAALRALGDSKTFKPDVAYLRRTP